MLEFLARVSQWLLVPAIVAFFTCFAISPLFAWRRTRPAAALVILLASYVMGAYVFITACGVTWYFLGLFWFIVLLFFLGVGPVFASIVIFLWHHQFTDAAYMVVALIAIFGWRAVAIGATSNTE